MDKIARAFLALTFSLVCAAPAAAGIADSPLPVLEPGKPTLHIYSVPGVMRAGCAGTYFSCTSTDATTMRVGVEIFDHIGVQANDPVGTSWNLAPGGAVVFGTEMAVDFVIFSDVGGFIPDGGSARILATSKSSSAPRSCPMLVLHRPAISGSLPSSGRRHRRATNDTHGGFEG